MLNITLLNRILYIDYLHIKNYFFIKNLMRNYNSESINSSNSEIKSLTDNTFDK